MKTISRNRALALNEDTPMRRMIGKIMRRISFRRAVSRDYFFDVGQTGRFIISLEKT
jgi:hypothetical protein